MSVTYNEQSKTFFLDTFNSTYAFCVSEKGFVEHLYYGKSIPHDEIRYLSNRQAYSFAAHAQDEERTFALSTILAEVTSQNSSDFRDGSVCVTNADGSCGNFFSYKSHAIKKGRSKIPGLPHSRQSEDCESLELVLTDEEKGVRVTLYYVIYPSCDVIARYLKITNASGGKIYLQKAGSINLDLYRSDLDLIEIVGTNGYELAGVQRNPLKKGIQGVKSSLGAVSHYVNPFFMLAEHNATEDGGEAYGFNLLYSSSFKNQIEVDRLGSARVITGVNDDYFNYGLEIGEEFYTPEAIITFTDKGLGQVSRNFHDHIRQNIMPPKFAYARRPIVINSWEGSGFDVNEKLMLELADEAINVGADMLVLDDGWFRNDTFFGLGDFDVIDEKFPDGLKALSEKIHDKGLKFGIWFEPECVAIQSNLYKNKPDVVLTSRKSPVIMRDQFIIDFTVPENVDDIFNKMCKVLDGLKVEYLKWDYNRFIHEAGSLVTPSGEVLHKQMLGVYRLYEMLTERYPEMMFEGCSGGGGRVDLGMIYYNPQIWLSDNTDPYGRLYMQYNASYGYPTSCMSSHLTENFAMSKRPSDNEFRYLVASFGVYGYEFDLRKLTADQKKELLSYSKDYAENYEFSLNCDLYRIISPDEHLFEAYVQVTKDKKKAQFTFIEINSTGFYENVIVRLKGLDETKRYRNLTTGEILSGKTLTSAGVRIGNLFVKGSGSGIRTVYEAVE